MKRLLDTPAAGFILVTLLIQPADAALLVATRVIVPLVPLQPQLHTVLHIGATCRAARLTLPEVRVAEGSWLPVRGDPGEGLGGLGTAGNNRVASTSEGVILAASSACDAGENSKLKPNG